MNDEYRKKISNTGPPGVDASAVQLASAMMQIWLPEYLHSIAWQIDVLCWYELILYVSRTFLSLQLNFSSDIYKITEVLQ